MNIIARFKFLPIFLLAFGLAACGNSSQRQASDNVSLLTREKALEIAKAAAIQKGYDLEKFELSTFGKELDTQGNQWLFVYMCKPSPAPPGCGFMASVNRSTGATEISPGG